MLFIHLCNLDTYICFACMLNIYTPVPFCYINDPLPHLLLYLLNNKLLKIINKNKFTLA